MVVVEQVKHAAPLSHLPCACTYSRIKLVHKRQNMENDSLNTDVVLSYTTS